MRQAHARKITDAYLDAPKRSEHPHLHVVEDLRVEAPRVAIPEPDPAWDAAFSDGPELGVAVPDPAIADPDWARPFADPRWDDDLGGPDYEERDGRRTVLVTGRPAGTAVPRRDSTPGPTARMRRHTPTRARLAGRPDRVALWAVALALVMAAMAGFTGNGHHGSSSSQGPQQPSAAPLLSR
jgi:hypothetical protein